MYTTKHAQILYRVASSQTIRNWTKEFHKYLSPTATPEKGNTRQFTVDDMRVFSLIAEFSKDSKSFTEIHAALKANQRGAAPTVKPEELDGLAAGEIEIQLNTQLHEAQELANSLQSELAALKERFQPIHEENIRLQAQIEDRDSRITELNQQLKDAQERIAKLAEEKGEAYVRGVMEAMKQKNNLLRDE